MGKVFTFIDPMQRSDMWIIRDAVLEDAFQIAQVHVQAWKESYHGIFEEDYLNSISFEERLDQRHAYLSSGAGKMKTLVACEPEGKIFGFCDVGAVRKGKPDVLGEVYSIYILKKYQSRGGGTALWKQSIAYLRSHRLIPYCVAVLEQNVRACKFYKKMRGTILETRIMMLGGEHYKEIIFIFK